MDTPKQPASQPNQQPPDEKLEFLKREEVRTMAKDIAKIREEEAKKERERIASFKKEADLPKKPQVVLSQHPEERSEALPQPHVKIKRLTPAPKQPFIPRRPLKRSEKLFVRLVVGGILVFLIFNAIAFGFWYFFKQNTEQQPKSADIQQEIQIPPVPTLPEPQPEPILTIEDEGQLLAKIPVAFFEAPQQELLLETSSELMERLQVFLAENPAPGFVHIVMRIQENILPVSQFFEETSLVMPQELKEKLGENLMLFSYVVENKKRLGFIAKLKETEGVGGLLQSWEQSMEQDLAPFFDSIGSKGSAYTPFFRSTTYQEVQVRFQTFSVIDFGIVYGILQDKLLLTSSFESFTKAVDQLTAL